MGRILQEIDNHVDAKQWLFATNTPENVPQQQSTYDCGVFLYFLQEPIEAESPVPSLNSGHAFQCHMILELHKQELSSLTLPSIQTSGITLLLSTREAISLAVPLEVLMAILSSVSSSCTQPFAVVKGFNWFR